MLDVLHEKRVVSRVASQTDLTSIVSLDAVRRTRSLQKRVNALNSALSLLGEICEHPDLKFLKILISNYELSLKEIDKRKLLESAPSLIKLCDELEEFSRFVAVCVRTVEK